MNSLPVGVRAVFFDAVGTLIHPDPPALVKYRELALRHGVELTPEEVRTRFVSAFIQEEQIDRKQNWQTSEQREVTRWRRIVERTLPELAHHPGCFSELYDHFGLPAAWTLDRHATKVFDALADRGLIVGMGSNYDRRLNSVIEGHPQLLQLRPHIVISSVIGTRKPSPAFFQQMIAGLNLQPAEVLFIGDDLDNDYEGARAAGMHSLLLDPQTRHLQCQRIGSLDELLNQIE